MTVGAIRVLGFTLPSELRWLAMNHPGLLYGAFFRIVGAILEEMGTGTTSDRY
ncbi:MAG: hypothetical protein P4L36_21630 [Holophaga sp.]|nr:hypothetical protein [Holophaga sp.]